MPKKSCLINRYARTQGMMKNTISSRNTAIIQAKTLVFSAYSGNWSCFSSNSLIMRRLRAFSCHFRAIFLLFRRVLQVCAEFYRKIGLRLLEGVFCWFPLSSYFLSSSFPLFFPSLCILCLCVLLSGYLYMMRKGEKNTFGR